MAERYLNIGGTYWIESPTGERRVVTDPTILRQLTSGELKAEPATLRGTAGLAEQTPLAPAPTTPDASASFLAGLTGLLERMRPPEPPTLPAPPPTLEPELLEREREIGRRRIETAAAITREELEQTRRLGFEEIARSRQLLGFYPVTLRDRVERFTADIEKFAGNISRALERLNIEEQNALEQNDLNYLKQIRQAKIDAFNMQMDLLKTQRQFQQDAWQMMKDQITTALTAARFSRDIQEFERTYGLRVREAELREAEVKRKAAADRLEAIVTAVSGRGYDALSPAEKAELDNISSTLGIPLDSIQRLLTRREVKHFVKTDTAIYAFDDQGRLVSSFPLPRAVQAGSAEDWWNAYLSGDVTALSSIPADFRNDVVNRLNLLRGRAASNLILQERQMLPQYLKNITLTRLNLLTKGRRLSPQEIERQTRAITGEITNAEIREELLRKVVRRMVLENRNAAFQYLDASVDPNISDEQLEDYLMRYSTKLKDLITMLVPEEYIARIRSKATDPFSYLGE